MRRSPLKSIVNLTLVVFFCMGAKEFCEKYNYDIHKFADAYDKEHKLGKYSSATDIKEKRVSTIETERVYEENVVYLHGFGQYEEQDLEIIKEGINKFYGMRVVIDKPFENPSNFYFLDNTSMIKARSVITLGQKDGDGYHVYVTNYALCRNENETNLISGHALLNTKTSVVSTYQMKQNGHYNEVSLVHTANHELAHNFGLSHCDDTNCLMKSHGLDTEHLCENCKNKLNL